VILLKNSKGKPDFAMTAAVVSLATVLLKALAGGAVIQWGARTLTVGNLDAGLAAAILASTFTAYVFRRKHDNEQERALAGAGAKP
jgi:hypothetical protein